MPPNASFQGVFLRHQEAVAGWTVRWTRRTRALRPPPPAEVVLGTCLCYQPSPTYSQRTATAMSRAANGHGCHHTDRHATVSPQQRDC